MLMRECRILYHGEIEIHYREVPWVYPFYPLVTFPLNIFVRFTHTNMHQLNAVMTINLKLR